MGGGELSKEISIRTGTPLARYGLLCFSTHFATRSTSHKLPFACADVPTGLLRPPVTIYIEITSKSDNTETVSQREKREKSIPDSKDAYWLFRRCVHGFGRRLGFFGGVQQVGRIVEAA